MFLHQGFDGHLPLHFGQLKDGFGRVHNKVQDSFFSNPELEAILFVVRDLFLPGLNFLQKIEVLLVSSWVLADGSFSELQSLCPSVDLGLKVNGWHCDSLGSFLGIFTLFLQHSHSLGLLLFHDIIKIAKVAIESNESHPSQVLIPITLVDVLLKSVLLDL